MLDRKTAPPFVQSLDFGLIRPERKSLPNNINILFLPGGDQEVLKLDVVFQAGRWFERQTGIAHFTTHLLSKGTATKSSFDIAEGFERYGAHLEVSPGLDFVTVSIYALARNLQPVIDLLHEILTEPSFPENELEQFKAIQLQNLRINLEKTSFLASKAFRKTLFGETHPYGKELEASDIEAVNTEALEEHFRSCFKSPLVVVAGKFGSEAQKSIEDLFSSWSPGTYKPIEFARPASHARRSHVAKEDAVQASIRAGFSSLLRSHPDYPDIIFAAHLLGGYFGSRLMKNIREEKGLTYGIHASIQPLRNDSYLVIGTDVNKDAVDLTLREIRAELTRLIHEPVSMEELTIARNHFIGSLQSELTTPFAHADKWRSIELHGLSPVHYANMISRISKLTPEKLMEISSKYFKPDELIEISIG